MLKITGLKNAKQRVASTNIIKERSKTSGDSRIKKVGGTAGPRKSRGQQISILRGNFSLF